MSDQFLDTFSVDDRTSRWSEILRQPEQVCFVAEVEGENVVGFASGGKERSGRIDFRGELYGLYVLPSWHDHGIGKDLVAAFVQWLTNGSIDTMLVWTLSANPFRGFYERLGGQRIADRTIDIVDQKLGETAYGWTDLGMLIVEAKRLNCN